jgi:hypothetical protein
MGKRRRQTSRLVTMSRTRPSLKPGMHAVAVQLDLMQPFRALRSRFYQRGQLA